MTTAIRGERPNSPDALQLLSELDEFLQQMAYPPESRHAFSVERLIREKVVFFVTYVDENPAGCGGIKLFRTDYGEVKRMYVRPGYRGQGLGRLMLNRLEDFASGQRVKLLRLETGVYQTEAIALYERSGFQRCLPFGDYKVDPLSIYFEKSIR